MDRPEGRRTSLFTPARGSSARCCSAPSCSARCHSAAERPSRAYALVLHIGGRGTSLRVPGVRLAFIFALSAVIVPLRASAEDRSPLLWPVVAPSSIAGFGQAGRGPEDGIDIKSAPGSAIVAAHGGEMTVAALSEGRSAVMIDDGDHLTLYRPVIGVSRENGSEVAAGDTIGTIAPDSILHFKLQQRSADGALVGQDPVPLLASRRASERALLGRLEEASPAPAAVVSPAPVRPQGGGAAAPAPLARTEEALPGVVKASPPRIASKQPQTPEQPERAAQLPEPPPANQRADAAPPEPVVGKPSEAPPVVAAPATASTRELPLRTAQASSANAAKALPDTPPQLARVVAEPASPREPDRGAGTRTEDALLAASRGAVRPDAVTPPALDRPNVAPPSPPQIEPATEAPPTPDAAAAASSRAPQPPGEPDPAPGWIVSERIPLPDGEVRIERNEAEKRERAVLTKGGRSIFHDEGARIRIASGPLAARGSADRRIVAVMRVAAGHPSALVTLYEIGPRALSRGFASVPADAEIRFEDRSSDGAPELVAAVPLSGCDALGVASPKPAELVYRLSERVMLSPKMSERAAIGASMRGFQESVRKRLAAGSDDRADAFEDIYRASALYARMGRKKEALRLIESLVTNQSERGNLVQCALHGESGAVAATTDLRADGREGASRPAGRAGARARSGLPPSSPPIPGVKHIKRYDR